MHRRPFLAHHRLKMLVMACLPVTVAGGLAQSSINVGFGVGYPGTTASVPVYQMQASNVVAVQFDLHFNAGKVTALDALRAGLPSNCLVRSRTMASGVERVVVYSLTNFLMPVNVALAKAPFQISQAEHVSSGPIVPSNSVLARLDGTAVSPVLGKSGEIFMQPVHLRTNGVADFFFASQPGTNYTIQATTNFIHWVSLTNLLSPSNFNFMDLVDPDAPFHPYRFYRWTR